MKRAIYKVGLYLMILLCVFTTITYSGGAPNNSGHPKNNGQSKDEDSTRSESEATNNKPNVITSSNDSQSGQKTATRALSDSKKLWYRDPDVMSAIGSIGAVIISIFALYASYQGQSAQQLREKREELRGVLEKLISLREEQVTTSRLKDEVEKAFTSGYQNTKRAVYLESAESIARQISKHVTASEYYVLGLENYWDSDYIQAKMYYRLAADKSQNSAPTKQSEIWRSIAGIYFLQDPAILNLQEGRQCFRNALTVLEGHTDYYSSYVRTLAYSYWAGAELSCKNYDRTAILLDKAYNEWLIIPEETGLFRGNDLRIIANCWREIGVGYCQESQSSGEQKIVEGREAFKKALEILQSLNVKYGINSDYIIDARAMIYQVWGQQEINAGFSKQGLQLLEEAKKHFMSLSEGCAWKFTRCSGITSLLLQFGSKNTELQTAIGQDSKQVTMPPKQDPNLALGTDYPRIGLPQ
jgi:hypothetical protein